MGDANGRIGLVDVLAARAGSAKRIDAQFRRIQVAGLDFVGLRKNGHGAGRGVDASLRFGGGHALHAMHAGFELETRERARTRDAADDFAVAAVLASILRQDFHGESMRFGVTRVHAEQVTGEDGGLVTARARAHLEEDVLVVARIAWNQQRLEFALGALDLGREAHHFLAAHVTHCGIAVVLHFPRGGELAFERLECAEFFRHGA